MSKRASAVGSLGHRIRGLRGETRLDAIKEVVARWRASGKSRTAFCREVGIATVTLARWIRRLDASQAEAPSGPVLVEIDVQKHHGRDPFEVVLSNGTRVRVPAGFVEEELARLLGVLAAAC